jgi:hypothetical protein
MTATNHALTGAIIGLSVVNPAVAGIAAVASHFVCDAIPHYGREDSYVQTENFRNYLILDSLLCIVLVLVVFVAHPMQWFVAALCAFLATSPDLLWIPTYFHRHMSMKVSTNAFLRFAKRIQWFEKPSGAVVEFAWFFGSIAILYALLGR